ncbi:TPA: glycosyltransferase family 4 protein [Citrobacter werkmanii]
MRVLFAAPPYINLDKNAGGVFNEMKARERSLNSIGVEVEYLSLEHCPDWDKIDLCHLFMANEGSYGLGLKLKAKKKLVVSPIIDRANDNFSLKLFLNLSKKIPMFYTNFERCYELCKIADGVLVRSNEEKDKVNNIFGIKNNVGIAKIPFIFTNKKSQEKEDFVFFLGDIGNPRKNLKRLITACDSINKKLVIAGVKSEGPYGDEVIHLINRCNNVNYVGKLTQSEKFDYMDRARVFALPSLVEGVGLSALEALEYGCNVVITKNGGVKDYFGNDVIYVNPNSDEDIRNALVRSFNENLQYHYNDDANFESVGQVMFNYYKDIIDA